VTFAVITGTRPEIIKMFPVIRLFDMKGIDYKFIHTGQHYDHELFLEFLNGFKIREPDYRIKLASPSGSPQQFGEMMASLGNILQQLRPLSILVIGDTNSVAASALTATKLKLPVIHIESGLRSNDWRMPEEYNRRMVDHISDILFSPTIISTNNLANERVCGTTHFVGNTVIDAVKLCMPQAMSDAYADQNKYDFLDYTKSRNPSNFVLLTLHREENVDNRDILKCILTALSKSRVDCVCPMHPRTVKRIHEFNLEHLMPNRVIPPINYFNFLRLLKMCSFVITDSGGIQEEITSPYINKHALVLRNSTERPESVLSGHAMLCKINYDTIFESIEKIRILEEPKTICPFGDGNSADKIVEILKQPVIPLKAKITY
jgi:UDP-N-acetylglucosamine 2-epimerase (non-hydrolysing)